MPPIAQPRSMLPTRRSRISRYMFDGSQVRTSKKVVRAHSYSTRVSSSILDTAKGAHKSSRVNNLPIIPAQTARNTPRNSSATRSPSSSRANSLARRNHTRQRRPCPLVPSQCIFSRSGILLASALQYSRAHGGHTAMASTLQVKPSPETCKCPSTCRRPHWTLTWCF